MATVTMYAGGIGGTLNLPNTGPVVVPANGLITVQTSDVSVLLQRGAQFVNNNVVKNVFTSPLLATAGRLVASAALSNGTLAIANQPDVPRQGVVRIDPGTSAITAGNVAVSYVANDGTNTVDNVSAIMPGTTVVSTNTSKGIISLTSVIITAMAGGASPKVQLNDTNSLSLMVAPNYTNFTLLAEFLNATNEASGFTVATSAASVTPSTAPNGSTNSFTIIGTFQAPAV